ncbi:MAG: 4-hydroxybutyrate--acetyl-CoA CoA transferase, partial [Spirochaetes bacterium]|nr:4-hydroxybutyrate--acetyl-CoA CoA transferase [Spirochaetota bacterium]MBU1080501.1 4-hydroxybutyrate--acetyl-CoA CoA transferase [Spirochaetota bacterium]MBU1080944.1 4-hydroxybutyrate--acetyl-CoA CoA transferase [Spirochaetota bacterium]
HVVTEHGVARLRGRTVRERVAELVAVAAPEFREDLKAQARKLGYI